MKIKVSAVQSAPIFLNKKETVDKACELIKEAGKNGAKLIVFPEGFIPSHPIWYHFHPATSMEASKLSVELFKNSIEVPSAEIAKLQEASKKANAYVIMGICERIHNKIGTLYNTQIFLGPNGEYLGKHQKIMPTVGEKLVHTIGDSNTFGTINTEYGPISGMMCSENSNPLAIFALGAEGTRIHAASWPNHWGKESKPMRKYVEIASKNFAQVTKAFVISSCSIINEEIIEKLNITEKEISFLLTKNISGGSMIVSPEAEIIAGPMDDEEGIIYAEIDLDESILHKLHHDFTGSYNRPDMFTLKVNKNNQKMYCVDNKFNEIIKKNEEKENENDKE